MKKYKWEDVRDFMEEMFAQHYSDDLLVEAGERMQLITTKLGLERGLDESPNHLFGSDVELGPESTEEFEKLKSWYEQHKPTP